MKDSFILFTEQKQIIDKLSDEDAGKIIKAIYEYEATGILPKINDVLDIIIIPFKLALDKTDSKWEETKKKRSEAGKKGMNKRWKKEKTNDNNVITKITNDNNVIDELTNITVSVNDNVNVNVNNKENIKRKKFIAPTLDEIQRYVDEKKLSVNANAFFDYFEEGGWIDSKGNKVKNWKQKLLTWERYSIKSEKDVKNKKFEFEKNNENLSQLYDN